MLKRLLFTGCALFLLTACGTNQTDDNAGNVNDTTPANETAQKEDVASNEANQETSDNKEPTTANITNPAISFDDAVKIFQKNYPNAKVKSVDLDNDFGRLRYDIEGYDGEKEFEMEIDAESGEVKEQTAEIDRENGEFIDFSAIISPKRAIEIASARSEAKGLSLSGWTLEAEGGKQKFTIKYSKTNRDDDIEITIDAVTEEILEVDND